MKLLSANCLQLNTSPKVLEKKVPNNKLILEVTNNQICLKSLQEVKINSLQFKSIKVNDNK